MAKECRFKKSCRLGKKCKSTDDQAYGFCGIWKDKQWGEVQK